MLVTRPAPGSSTAGLATISAITGLASARLRQRDERLRARGVARVDAGRLDDRDPGTPCAREPGVRGVREDGVRGPEVARQAIGVVVRRADEHALEQLVLAERAADRDVERGFVVRQVVPVRVAVAGGEAEVGSLLADRERHLVEHDQGRHDLRDARDRHRVRRRGDDPASMPSTATDALPARGPGERGGRRGDRVDLLALDGRRDRVQRPQQGRGRVRADQQRDDRDRNEDARRGRANAEAGCSAARGRPARRGMPRHRECGSRARSARSRLRRPRRSRCGGPPTARSAPTRGRRGGWSSDRRTRTVRRRPPPRPSMRRPPAPESPMSEGLAAAAWASAASTSNVAVCCAVESTVPRPDASPPSVDDTPLTRERRRGRGCDGVVRSHPPKLPCPGRGYNHCVNTGVRCAGLRGSENASTVEPDLGHASAGRRST